MFPEAKPISIVFLDTQVFLAASFNFKSTPFQALLKHFASGRLRLITTDVTLKEIESNVADEVHKENTLHAGFIKKARLIKSVTLAEAIATVTPLDPDSLIKDLLSAHQEFSEAGRGLQANVSAVEAGAVFEKYFANVPPFSDASNKKFEFPDAFVLEALGRWAEDREEQMFVVSGDDLFREGCKKIAGLVPMSTTTELLDYLATEDEKRAQFLRDRVKDKLGEITEQAKGEFEGNYFWVEDEDGEATVTVNALDLIGEPEIISINSDFGTLQLKFDVAYTAHLDYRDSATSIRDKETGTLVYAENREEEVERKVKLTVEVEVSFNEEDPDEVTIDSVTVVSPSEGFGIQTSSSAAWPYK